MADGKKSFVLYTDLIHTVKKLPSDIRGDLFLLILEYVNDLNPVIENNLVLEVAFEPIKQQLKRDLKEWEGEKYDRKSSGTLGNIARWHPDIYKQIIDKQITIEEAIASLKSTESHGDNRTSSDSVGIGRIANIAVNATVNATANDNVTENSKYKLPAAAQNGKHEALGSVKVKEIANLVWKDAGWRENLCIGLSLTEASLKKWMGLFNASVAQDTVEDFTEKRYKRMIRGWVMKQKEKGVIIEDATTHKTQSSSAPLKKLNQ